MRGPGLQQGSIQGRWTRKRSTASSPPLALKEKLAASSQNQALAALLFINLTVLGGDVGSLEGLVHAHQPRRLPVVLSKDEVRWVFVHLQGSSALVGNLLYGSGLRLTEALRVRIKDSDFEKRQLPVRSGKGDKDRISMLPFRLIHPLGSHLETVRQLYTPGKAQPHRPITHTKCIQAWCTCGWNHETGDLPQAKTFFCYAPIGQGYR